jgi:Putative Flp pilus-assembly TadE/G-like
MKSIVARSPSQLQAMRSSGFTRRVRRQSGQVLVLGLAVLFAGSLALYFMFNTGQVNATKHRLTNAADAAAYSSALWRARVLNFHAYSNRAIIAQEVAVAQAVTLVSWAKYFKTLTQNIADYTSWFPPAWVLQYLAYGADYSQQLAEAAAEIEIPARAASNYGYKELLQTSQEILNLTVDIFGMGAVANEIVKANDSKFFAFALPDGTSYSDFTRRYESDDDRQRMKTMINDSLDPFVTYRGAQPSILPPGSCIPTNASQLQSRFIRRGGTTLGDGLERWEAADTLSTHIWIPRRRLDPRCGGEPEVLPLGYGAAETSETEQSNTVSENPGGSTSANPSGTSTATSEMLSNDAYSGVSKVRELNYEALSNTRFPTSGVAVLARFAHSDLRTSGQLRVGTGRLQLNESLADNRMWALSAAEVYFSSPDVSVSGVQYASLYSPYWQVRLVEPSTTQRLVADGYVR